MLYIKENIDKEILKKYGFKKCKKPYDCLYYLCLSRGICVIFIGQGIFIQEWNDNDPRIHAKANCKYSSYANSIDILYELIKDGLVEQSLF